MRFGFPKNEKGMKDLDVFVEILICVLPSLQSALLVQCILIKRLRKQEEVKEWRNKEKKRIIKFWTIDLRIGEEEEMMPLIYGRRARKRENSEASVMWSWYRSNTLHLAGVLELERELPCEARKAWRLAALDWGEKGRKGERERAQKWER
jgi:hypothetical protein